MTSLAMKHPSVFAGMLGPKQLLELAEYVLEAKPSTPQEVDLFNDRLRIFATSEKITEDKARTLVREMVQLEVIHRLRYLGLQ